MLGEIRIWKLERCILATTCDRNLARECYLFNEKTHNYEDNDEDDDDDDDNNDNDDDDDDNDDNDDDDDDNNDNDDNDEDNDDNDDDDEDDDDNDDDDDNVISTHWIKAWRFRCALSAVCCKPLHAGLAAG